MLEGIARKVLETYFFEPGEAVLKVRPRHGGFIVETGHAWWRVGAFEPWPNFVKSGGYNLIEVNVDVFFDPIPPPHGVALVADDGMFHLNDDQEFRKFFQAVPTLNDSVEIASLLTHYRGWDSEFGVRQTLILRREDLAGSDLLDERQIEALPELISFQSNRTSEGILTVEFCTFYLRPEPPDRVLRVGLNRWRVAVDSERRLSWSHWPIAESLDSPAYSATKREEVPGQVRW
jgi:hypothetical protein